MGIPYSKNCKKAELIQKVKEAKKARNTTQCNMPGVETDQQNSSITAGEITENIGKTTSSTLPHPSDHNNQPFHKEYKMEWAAVVPYYFDEKRERLYYLLLYLLFLLEMIGAYLDSATFLYIICILQSIILSLILSAIVYLLFVVLTQVFHHAEFSDTSGSFWNAGAQFES